MLKFKVGDKVKLRNDLIIGRQYGEYFYDIGMYRVAKPGEIVEIKDISTSKTSYNINGEYCFCDEMIECKIEECDIENYKRNEV